MQFRFLPLAWALTSVLSAQGVITTIAGTDPLPPSGPTPALGIYLALPSGVAADSEGDLFVADQEGNVIYKILPEGKASVVAGTGISGYSGDGGPATLASLASPEGVAVDTAGNIYFSQSGGVREISSSGVITTIAGGPAGDYRIYTGNTNQYLIPSDGIAAGPSGQVYLSLGDRVLVIKNGAVKVFAGTGSFNGYMGDGACGERFPHSARVGSGRVWESLYCRYRK